jgi:putative protein-disulfide isomerase
LREPGQGMSQPHLIYIADPMCSWCWGFAPTIESIRQRFGDALPIRLMMGGLRPGTTKPLDEAGRRKIRGHWEHVREASGQPFDFRFFEREAFVYDTEPASRAVVVMRRAGLTELLAFLHRIQAAFYAENRDVTDEQVPADIAAQSGRDREVFLQAFRGEEAKQETWHDFASAQRAGITGFPTLMAGVGEGAPYTLVAQGYQPADCLIPPLTTWLEVTRGTIGPSKIHAP